MKKKVWIDGSAGTTGLRILERLEQRTDLELIRLSEENRKDPAARKEAMEKADLAFLCLPDDAAKEASEWEEAKETVIIDTSTAHRTSPGWTYGFPELTGKSAISASKRIANPGCHASGFLALTAPMVKNKLLRSDARLSCTSLTGYSGGGKKMIAQYEAPDRNALFDAPRLYALEQKHKHLKEMQAISGLIYAPVFLPIVAPFYSGMEVIVPLFENDRTASPDAIRECYRETFRDGLVKWEDEAEDGFLSASALSGKDTMKVGVYGNEERLLLIARFDNLGKGASGSAIQNMNLVFGFPEEEGLVK